MGAAPIKITRKSKDFFDLPLQKKKPSSVDLNLVSSAGKYSLIVFQHLLASFVKILTLLSRSKKCQVEKS